MTKPKPHLILMRGEDITAEDVAELYRRLTGKTPTPQQIQKTQSKLDRARNATKGVAPPMKS